MREHLEISWMSLYFHVSLFVLLGIRFIIHINLILFLEFFKENILFDASTTEK